MPNGANAFTLEELEALLGEDTQPATPPVTGTNPQGQNGSNGSNSETDKNSENQTQAFAHRLKESTQKAVAEERENIAKSLGYESYEMLLKSREENLMKDKGLDPEQVAPVVEELVKQRLNEDPRMKELEEFRKAQIAEFAKTQLAELNELTGENYKNLKSLPKPVLEAWSNDKNGSLYDAFMKVEGRNFIKRLKGEQSRGTTQHMSTVQGGIPSDNGKRSLTPDEKKLWKFFNPNATDEEIEQKRVNK